MREGRLADPAQGEGGDGDAELGRGEIGIEMLDGALQRFGIGASGRDQLDDAAAADRDERKFGGDEKAVSENQGKYREKLGNGDHTAVFARHGLLAIWTGTRQGIPVPSGLRGDGHAIGEAASRADLC